MYVKPVVPSEALVYGRSPAHRAINSPSSSYHPQWAQVRRIPGGPILGRVAGEISQAHDRVGWSQPSTTAQQAQFVVSVRVFVLDHFRNNNRQTKPPINTQHLDTLPQFQACPRV
jgi:hypothetical protein